jgi:hypothetical protein
MELIVIQETLYSHKQVTSQGFVSKWCHIEV